MNIGEQWIMQFLTIIIALFVAGSLLFLAFLFAGRYRKIYDAKLAMRYDPVINRIVFPILFNNQPVHKALKSAGYQTYFKKKQFRKILLNNILQLHINYSGDHSRQLEELYRESGLVKISFEKLKSRSWSEICEGIRELSEMNTVNAYDDIFRFIRHRHSTLKLEALIGIIRLKGLAGLSVLDDYTEPINDWIQLNLLYEISNTRHESDYDFSRILESTNESNVMLGLRLIENFNQIRYMHQVKGIADLNSSGRVKKQATQTLAKLSSLNSTLNKD